jgi:hypothetical protein
LEEAAMPTVGEAKMAARAWIREEAVGIPSFVGAYLAGSILAKSDADTFPKTSDVDLSIVVDSAVPNQIIEPDNSLSPRKLLYRGLILEPSSSPSCAGSFRIYLCTIRIPRGASASFGAIGVCYAPSILGASMMLRIASWN